jgi:glucose-6-phosphate 1-dehydrogenase
VFFGATGDLAYKKIFPALQAMARCGRLDFPVVGVAKAGWTFAQFVERARASLAELLFDRGGSFGINRFKLKSPKPLTFRLPLKRLLCVTA